MDFDKGILTLLRDRKPRIFQQILSETIFSHNTLRKHLDELVDQDLVTRLKSPRKGLGRPLFTYRLQRGAERAVSVRAPQ